MVFRRRAVTAEPVEPVAEPHRQAGKGRPTPKRSDAQKRRRNAAPKTRKEAAAMSRERTREIRAKQRTALATGDERNLPPRDAGAERRLARDIVDSKFTFGQIFFPLILVTFLLSIVNVPAIQLAAEGLALAMLATMVLDGLRISRIVRDRVTDSYGEKAATGIRSYTFMRAMQPRRMRRPPPKVDRGAEV